MIRPRILLINPWIYDFAAVNMWARPLGLLQVAEFLSAYSVELRWLDCMDLSRPARKYMRTYPKQPMAPPPALAAFPRPYYRYGISEESFREQLQSALPVDAILVSSIMAYWYPGVLEVIRLCKQAAPKTPIILGGLYARLFPRHAAEHSQAEIIYSEDLNPSLLTHLAACGLPLSLTGPPQPYYSMGFYSSPTYAPLLTSEGCLYACPYCACAYLHPQFRQYPIDSVFRDVLALYAQGVGDFAFYDDALLANPDQHINPLLERIGCSGIQARFHTPNGLHARFMNATTARLMHRAGFKTIRLSLETTNPLRQQALGGKVELSHLQTAVEQLKTAGFTKQNIGVYLLYGLPDQPSEEIYESIRILKALDVRIHLSEFSPIPHTPFWQELVRHQVITEAIDPVLTNNTVFSALFANYSAETLKDFKDTVAKCNQ